MNKRTFNSATRGGSTTCPNGKRDESMQRVLINTFVTALADALARAFGVKVLDHNRCGLTYQNMDTYNPDELHPNKFGHSLVANNDIRQMDGTVGRRYPLS